MMTRRLDFIAGIIAAALIATCCHPLGTTTSTKIRVCTGSSCLSKCRGVFNPKSTLDRLQKTDDPVPTVDIEEAFCMNQCKRGPNMRIIRNGQVMTFEDDTIMNEMELKRKSFQNVRNDDRVAMVWELTRGVVEGKLIGTEAGSSSKLTDILPGI
mmetsp:Transcript_39806/g.77761  ORF Transcript_39806/g.77761 Transcript_39806/m.77761 type:complete len:155 (+) Transcript_39806:55-519(+)